jgi:DNA invertase Pin-like site-specific DNA recombinase
MRTPQPTNDTKTAIGYVRVSTQEQATEGVSLDAQRDRLRTYCKLHGFKLIDIAADEGYSGSTLERPGLQAALQLIRRGQANTLLVVKLDRLSRSLRDVCTLVEELFSDEGKHLLSLCGMANTHTAAGRMTLMNLANYHQYERELISERTRDALQHMKAQGIPLGHAPYGYEHSRSIDDKGRRVLVPLSNEQTVISRIAAMNEEGVKFGEIARRLNAEQAAGRKGGKWRTSRISVVLQREGKYKVRTYKSPSPRVPLHYDRKTATARAKELRAEGLSLREVGLRLRKERLTPLRGGIWHPAQVAELLRGAQPRNREATARLASALRAQGMQLREIGVRLAMDGYLPKEGGLWHPARVHELLASAEPELSAE